MPNYTPPEIYILNVLAEGILAGSVTGSIETPVEGEVIPW